MKFQTNPQLGKYLNKWGCHICSIIQKVEKRAPGYRFTNEDVVKIYETAMRHGYVQQEVKDSAGNPLDGCDVLDGAGLYNTAAEMYGRKTRAAGFRREAKDYTPKPNEEEILELKRNGYKGSHFVSGNGAHGVPLKAEIEFDPIEGGSLTAAWGWIESKRILTIE